MFTFNSVSSILFGKGFHEGRAPRGGADLMLEPLWHAYPDEARKTRPCVLSDLPDVARALRLIAQWSISGQSAREPALVSTRVRAGVALRPVGPVMALDSSVGDFSPALGPRR